MKNQIILKNILINNLKNMKFEELKKGQYVKLKLAYRDEYCYIEGISETEIEIKETSTDFYYKESYTYKKEDIKEIMLISEDLFFEKYLGVIQKEIQKNNDEYSKLLKIQEERKKFVQEKSFLGRLKRFLKTEIF
ncbi:hypothetical protein DLH72_01225 [Candidatus Gracilibacteria bacterium]|nr:MAG: hypothetical protein DLH72_01225 [Candidatus Gracilibacteria bacterium]